MTTNSSIGTQTLAAAVGGVIRPNRSYSTQRLLVGGIWGLVSQVVMAATLVLTVAYVTRSIGPASYGRLAISLTIVAWIQWTIVSITSRTTVVFVSSCDDWQPIATTMLRLQLGAGALAAATLALLSWPIAGLLDDPVLARYLALLAIDIPIFCLAKAHRHILVGLGHYRQGVGGQIVRNIARICLIVVLIQVGFSVEGAILGTVGASVVELLVYRSFVAPALWPRSTVSIWNLTAYLGPLFLFSLSMQIFGNVDLLTIHLFNASAKATGVYAAAANLAQFPLMFMPAVALPLLSTLSGRLAAGDRDGSKRLVRHALRTILLTLPFTVLVASEATAIVRWIFGAEYVSGATVLTILSFGSLARMMFSVATTVLTAGGRPGLCLALAGPLVPAAVVMHCVCIPRWGMTGAALATAALALLAAIASLVAVQRIWHVLPPLATLARCLLLSAVLLGLSANWTVDGAGLLFKLPVLMLTALLGFVVLSEFKPHELALMRACVRSLVVLRVRQAETPNA